MLLGVDIGGTKCALIVSGDDGKILSREAALTSDVDKTLGWITEGAKRIAEKYEIKAVGISCGGPLDSIKGTINCPPNLPDWDGVPITKLLSEVTGAPAFLCNDANACALAEWKYGAGKGSRNMIFLTFGTGLGAGLILDGRLYEGTNGMAGEAGHIRLANDGPVGYGKRGSFEGFCSGGGIARLGAAMIEASGEYPDWCPDRESLKNLTAKTIAEKAKAGDPVAIKIYDASAEKLGLGLSILMDLFNPERIVIGSVFARSEELFRGTMERVIAREALAETVQVCQVVPAALGDAIGDYAAIAVASRGLEEMKNV